jgi:transcriptional regulator with XRE-family HTH domain
MSIGDTLADARQRSGLTVTQVSQQTRIRESIIRDIEQGDFGACGGDFYARGHIRSIAGAVGADPAPLISEYDADHGPVSPLRAAEVFEPAKPIKIRERRSPSLAMIVVLVLLAIIGYTAYRLVANHGKTGHPAAVASTPAPPRVTPTAVAKASPSPSPAATVSDLTIKVAAGQEACWVQLTRTSDGSQIYMGVIAPGTSMSWTEKHAVSLRLGNPGGIVLTVNGRHRNINTALPVTLNLAPPGQSSSGASSSGASSSGGSAGSSASSAASPASSTQAG